MPILALTGFTRIDSPLDEDTELKLSERRAPLARKSPRFVPASEVRGEGIFIQLREDAVAAWCAETVDHGERFFAAHRVWRAARGIQPVDAGFPELRFVLLHSFAHALMRQLAIECGYAAASIRERIYSARPEDDGGPMAGVLLYTAAPDSEGTLGGLVSLGAPETLGRHIEQALEHARLCSSDPLCAEHVPGGGGPTKLRSRDVVRAWEQVPRPRHAGADLGEHGDAVLRGVMSGVYTPTPTGAHLRGRRLRPPGLAFRSAATSARVTRSETSSPPMLLSSCLAQSRT